MAFCIKCGAQIEDNAPFCPSCGAQQAANPNVNNSFNANYAQQPMNGNYTGQFDPNDIQQNKGLSILSYIGILFLIPLLAAPNSPYARFHTNQGLVLFLADLISGVAIGILSAILIWIPVAGIILVGLISAAVGICLFVFMIMGIVNAATGNPKELPLIGQIKIIK